MRCAMVNRIKKVIALAALLLVVLPISASAAEIPFLTWERGQLQEVVLGGQAASENWRVELQGNGITGLELKKSSLNSQGFAVYSLVIPEDTPLGGYSIVAIDNVNEFNVVAGVNLIGSIGYKITKKPLDLALIITIFVFLTSIISALRARKYSRISFISTQAGPENSTHFAAVGASFLKRIASAPYRIRVRAVDALPNSLLRFLLLRDGELVHRLSHNFYSWLPIAGFLAGVVAVNETERAGGIGSTGLAIFIAVAFIGIFDAYSGFAALLGFWVSQLLIGNISSFRDILVMISVGISWLLPVLFASVIQTAIAKDFHNEVKGEPTFGFRLLGIIGSSFVGGAVFYLGQKLLNSVLVSFGDMRNVSTLAISAIVSALVIRGILDETILHADTNQHLKDESHVEEIIISRVSSPRMALAIFAVVFGFGFIWTQSAAKSAIIALIFTAPYLVLLVRFNEINSNLLSKAKRNILIEGILTTGASFLIFNQISTLPLLSQEKAQWFLIFSGIPGIIHSIYSAACDSSDRQEIIA
jgi:hypothetical protein